MNAYAGLAASAVAGAVAALVIVSALAPAAAPAAAPPAPGQQQPAMTASALSTGGSPVLGDPSAPVTILEWGDYQCTYCHLFHRDTLGIIKERYVETGRAKLVFKDFPLNGPDSALAAEATHCAAEQGMYWEYHDALYDGWGGERTGWITRGSLERIAAEAGLDAGMLGACLDGGGHRDTVASLEREGRQIGVDATPSFFVFDGERVVKIRGNLPIGAFEDAIAAVGGGGGGPPA